MTVLITLTIAGSDTGPFDLYSDVDGFVVPFETNVPKASLIAGYTSSLVPDGAVLIRVKSDSVCTNYIDLHMNVILNDPKMQHEKDYKNFKLSVEYELAIWGDGKLTDEQLIEIGRKSIKAGTLVMPAK